MSLGETDAQLNKKLKELEIPEDEWYLSKLSDTGEGRFARFSNGGHVLRTRVIPSAPNDFGVLQHEIFHVVTFLLDNIGMELVLHKSDEAYSYLIGYITTEIYKRVFANAKRKKA